MTIAVNNPMKLKPVLRLKGFGLSSPSSPPASPATAPRPVPPKPPTPAVAEPIAAKAVEEKAAIIAKRVAAYEAGKLEMKRRALEMQVTLAERFPACFKPPGQPRLPLKVGIDLDVLSIAPDLSETDLKQAIRSYVAAPEYYLVAIEGAVRVDLDGEPAGMVTPDQARWAQIKVGKRPTQGVEQSN